ncbi:LysR family transcriptional regulator [Pseudomonas sp.]|uniref:LysR family transcriptional regulator n=1 Tax=Pseudomonas sp. TaxID=306 RepID=UPI003A96E4F1
MDRLKAMANFVRIVDSGSLSSAADATGQSVASLVRSLAALERYLGVRLLNRSTRRMALTDEGEEYLGWSRRMLADFDDMEQHLEARDGTVRGLLRLTAPVEFGQRFIAPLVNQFLRLHSETSVELTLNDHVVALLDERLDLALRIGHLPDSAMVARQVGATRLITCASPDYLAGAPAVDTPESLQKHKCVTLASQGRQWYFRHKAKELAETIAPRLVCNQIRAAKLSCLQGIGITRLMHYQVADDLAEGRLVRILKDFEPMDLPVQLVYPHALQLSPRVRAFVEWACPQLEQITPNPNDEPGVTKSRGV